MEDIVLPAAGRSAVSRLLIEQRAAARLREWGLDARRKVLFYGPPGCGKTLGASVIAGELGLSLIRVRIEILFSRYMGETGAMLAAIFDDMSRRRAVYLFDEFDAIGKQRDEGSDVGEARRVVSTFLQLMDADASQSIVVAATNQRPSLDVALFRRFDDLIAFEPPARAEARELWRRKTLSHRLRKGELDELALLSERLSYADITRAADEALKTMVLDGREHLGFADFRAALEGIRSRAPHLVDGGVI